MQLRIDPTRKYKRLILHTNLCARIIKNVELFESEHKKTIKLSSQRFNLIRNLKEKVTKNQFSKLLANINSSLKIIKDNVRKIEEIELDVHCLCYKETNKLKKFHKKEDKVIKKIIDKHEKKRMKDKKKDKGSSEDNYLKSISGRIKSLIDETHEIIREIYHESKSVKSEVINRTYINEMLILRSTDRLVTLIRRKAIKIAQLDDLIEKDEDALKKEPTTQKEAKLRNGVIMEFKELVTVIEYCSKLLHRVEQDLKGIVLLCEEYDPIKKRFGKKIEKLESEIHEKKEDLFTQSKRLSNE